VKTRNSGQTHLNGEKADTNESGLIALGEAAQTIGILVPSFHLSVTSSNDTVTIKSSWRGCVPGLICLVLGLLHIVPLIVGHFLISETSPKRGEMLARAMPVAVFSLLWLWLGFRQILCKGKVSWQVHSPGFFLQCGRLFRRQNYTLSSEGLVVKMYVHKGNRPNVRLKYGQIVLSLIRAEQPDDEVIVGVVKNRTSAEHAFRVLRDFLGQGIDETSVEEEGSPPDALLTSIEGRGWKHLAKKSSTRSPFFGSMRMRSISAKEYPDRLVLKWFWSRWIVALFFLGISGCMCIGAIYVFEVRVSAIIPCMGLVVVCGVSGYRGMRILLGAQQISVENWNSTTTIRYGSFPFPETLAVPSEQLTARMYRCDIPSANRAIKPGHILLSLSNKKSPDSEFIVATASKKMLIAPIYEKLTEVLEQPYSDELLDEVQLPGGEIIKVTRQSLTGGGDAEDRKRTFRILSDDRAAFSRGWTTIATGLALAAMFSTGMVVMVVDNGDRPLLGRVVMAAALTLPFAAFGAAVAIWSWRTRHIVVDRSKNGISYKSLLVSPRRGKLICAITDIAAVQVCSVLGMISSGRSAREVMVCEINVVLRTSENKRINIVASQDCCQIQNDAGELAVFLGVPLLDHA